MKNIIILCQSEPQPSWTLEDTTHYRQYAIAEMEQEEKDYYVEKYGCREIYGYRETWLSLRRRVMLTGDKETILDWDVIDFAPTKGEACIFGDTDYLLSHSLHPLFDKVRQYLTYRHDLRTEYNDIENRITPCKFSRYSTLAEEYENKYTSVLKAKKLYSKSLKGEVDQAVIDEIKVPLTKEYMNKKNQLLNRMEQIKQELSIPLDI